MSARADVELVGLYWTISGPVEVHVGREWSLFDFADRCAEARKVGLPRHRDLARRPRARPRDVQPRGDEAGPRRPRARRSSSSSSSWTGSSIPATSAAWRPTGRAELLLRGGRRAGRPPRQGRQHPRHAVRARRRSPSASPSCARTRRAAPTRRSSTSSCRSTSTSGTLDTALAVVDGAGAANGGLAIDTWHMSKLGIAPDELRRIPLEYLSWVELSDGRLEDMDDLIDETVNHRELPGEGEFDVRGYVEACQDTATPARGASRCSPRSCATCRWRRSSAGLRDDGAQFGHERSSV